ncbi:hypothetical protein J4217_03800 [Candidatus Pacearchaeota archaeon]|nr:hypothetical protein [uncultured archaeon]AQS33236.1 hypothetical protein [uncultured archaeon]MBS3091543.1 hypothetical protein [Candidatus Pacearchaeota archaeon]
MKREKDKLTILINKEVKDKYKEFCEKKGLKIGKQVEIFMQTELEAENKRGKNAK